MNEEKKTSKRRLLVRYLILAACILLIAAVTVISVCAANDWFRVDVNRQLDNDTHDDAPDANPDDSDKNSDDGDDADDDTPTYNETSWVSPVAAIDVITPYDFTEDVSLRGCWHFHTGLDFAAEVGAPVVCCCDGTVESIVTGDELDGNTVTIRHSDGVKTVYSYIEVKEGLKEGDEVKRGDRIGSVADSTGAECMLEPHIHFEVIENGEKADPELFLDISVK